MNPTEKDMEKAVDGWGKTAWVITRAILSIVLGLGKFLLKWTLIIGAAAALYIALVYYQAYVIHLGVSWYFPQYLDYADARAIFAGLLIIGVIRSKLSDFKETKKTDEQALADALGTGKALFVYAAALSLVLGIMWVMRGYL